MQKNAKSCNQNSRTYDWSWKMFNLKAWICSIKRRWFPFLVCDLIDSILRQICHYRLQGWFALWQRRTNWDGRLHSKDTGRACITGKWCAHWVATEYRWASSSQGLISTKSGPTRNSTYSSSRRRLSGLSGSSWTSRKAPFAPGSTGITTRRRMWAWMALTQLLQGFGTRW
jgi:hypothetical protein